MDRGDESAHNNFEPAEQRQQMDNGRRREASEALKTRSERLYRSPDQAALLRTREPSELREDASRAWAPIHRRNFEEYVRAGADGKLEHGQAEQLLVHPERIARIALTSPERHEDAPGFWNHHGNHAAYYYRDLSQKYPLLQEQLRLGKAIEELRRDPNLKQATDFVQQ